MLYGIVSSVLGFLGIKLDAREAAEFEGLSEDEKKEAKAFKDIALKYELKPENLVKLLKNTEQTKRLLKAKKDSGTADWDAQIATHLTAENQQKLKSETNLEPKAMTDMLVTKLEQGQTAAAKPASTTTA